MVPVFLGSPIGVTQNLIGAFSHRIVVSNEKNLVV